MVTTLFCTHQSFWFVAKKNNKHWQPQCVPKPTFLWKCCCRMPRSPLMNEHLLTLDGRLSTCWTAWKSSAWGDFKTFVNKHLRPELLWRSTKQSVLFLRTSEEQPSWIPETTGSFGQNSKNLQGAPFLTVGGRGPIGEKWHQNDTYSCLLTCWNSPRPALWNKFYLLAYDSLFFRSKIGQFIQCSNVSLT